MVVTVTGPGPHCTPELGEPEIDFVVGDGWVIDIELVDPCTIGPPSDGSFSVSTMLDPLSPRFATVRVHDTPDGGEISTATLAIHPGADLEVKAIEPASSAQPLRFTIEGVGSCPDAEVSLPAPGVVRADFTAECLILPPGEHRFTLELEAVPLPAGEYEIQVIHHTELELDPVVTTRVQVWDATRCVPSATVHCLEQGRFRVSASWRDFQSRTGDGKALTTGLDDTGLFWFFEPDNIELTIKVLNACIVNDRIWVFVSSGSTVEYEIEVTDTATGQQRTYRNNLGATPELIADTDAFATCQ